MKKYAILTSLLALTACAGGSGGGDGIASVRRVSAITEDAIKNNQEVTGMASEIVIDDGAAPASVRAGAQRYSSFVQNGVEKKSYRLDETDFTMADEGFGGGALKFTVDDKGEITSFKVDNRSFERIKTENDAQFAGMVRIDHGEEKANLTYVSAGKDLDLQYADFGYYMIARIDSDSTGVDPYPVFAGGYTKAKEIAISANDVKNLAASQANGITFDGRAVGHVVAVRSANGGQGSGRMILLDSKDANLVFNKDNPNGILTAKFNNWYNVSYDLGTKQATFTNPTFSGTDTKDKAVDGDFYLRGDDAGEGGKLSATGAQFYYFGKDKDPTEAVGVVQVRDCVNCTDGNGFDESQVDEVRMNLGFGGKR